MTDLVIQQKDIIERILTLELVRVTERAAVSAARLRGRGDEKAADQAAVDAMRRRLAADGGRFGGLVETIVASPQFRNKRIEADNAE